MVAHRPPTALCALLGASLALTAITAGYGLRYTREWSERRGLPVEEQRRAFGGVPYFREPFVELTARLERTIPPGEGVLVEPLAEPGGPTGPRWHLYLAHYAHPIEFYVRRPELACVGFHYRAFVDHHLAAPALSEAEAAALEQRGVEWRLRMPAGWPLDGTAPELARRVDGAWVKHSL